MEIRLKNKEEVVTLDLNGVDESDLTASFEEGYKIVACDVPDYWNESSVEDKFWEYLDAVADTNEEIVIAAIELGIPLTEVYDLYYGTYATDEEMAENYVEEYVLLSGVPYLIKDNIDYAGIAYDLLTDTFCVYDGHYFRQ